jgi:hypothetical protein
VDNQIAREYGNGGSQTLYVPVITVARPAGYQPGRGRRNRAGVRRGGQGGPGCADRRLRHHARPRAFRSVLLAAKAVAFNLISLAAAYGVITWVWQDGHGSGALWGIPATGAITMWVPLMVFAFLFSAPSSR